MRADPVDHGDQEIDERVEDLAPAGDAQRGEQRDTDMVAVCDQSRWGLAHRPVPPCRHDPR